MLFVIFHVGAGSSNDSCSEVFHGISPESEPCVRAFAELLRTKKHQLKAYFNLHSFGQLLFIPNSYTTIFPSDFEQIVSCVSIREILGRKNNCLKYERLNCK